MVPLALLAALAAVIPFLPADDIAPPPGSELVPSSTISLTRSSGDAGVRSVTLHCEPSGGSHPRPQTACEDLLPADGDLAAMENAGVVCTLQYDPVHVTATGSWRGHPRTFDHVYANSCALHANTGSVFQF